MPDDSDSDATKDGSILSALVPQSLRDRFSVRFDEGWTRIKTMYTDNKPHMETDAVMRMSTIAFFSGFFIGGAGNAATANTRFENYAVGKKFVNRRDALRRKLDFGTVMFAKSGLKFGFRAAALTGTVMLLTTHTTAFRDHYSPAYFPAFSGLTTFLVHRALACGTFAFPLGIYGQLQALGLGLATGSTLSAVSWLYALYCDKSFNDAYRQFRAEYEAEMQERFDEAAKIKQIMKDENIPLRVLAYKRLYEMRKEESKAVDSVLIESDDEHDG